VWCFTSHAHLYIWANSRVASARARSLGNSMNVKFTIFYSLNCCIRIILYTVLHAIVFFFNFSFTIYLSCVLSSVFYTINVNDFLLAGNCMYSSVLYHFRVIRRWLIVTLKSEGHWRSSKLVPFEFGFLFAFHSIYGSILHHFRNKARYYLNIVIFHTPLHLTPPLRDHRRNIAIPFGTEKLALWAIPDGEKTLRISINVSTAYRRVRVTGRRQT